MRTKTLLITVALSAACAFQSIAQVYSVNAVGYVNTTVPAGPVFKMISNPLVTTDNRLEALIPNPSPGTIIYRFVGGIFVGATFDEFDLVWTPANVNLDFGSGAFIYNPAGAPQFTITFVGEVKQGTPVTNPIPFGYSIRSSMVPQAGAVSSQLGFPATGGDIIYKFDVAKQQFVGYSFDEFDLVWLPSEPTVEVGESFMVYKIDANGKDWTRNFSVNQ